MNINQNGTIYSNPNVNQMTNMPQNRNQAVNGNPSKHQLMKTIYESGFAAYDTALFLDTHPCDKEALAFYQKMNHIYNQAAKEYSTLYGPLRIQQFDHDSFWSWSEGPWPWEMEGC